MLPDNTRLLLVLPELFRSEGGIQIIGRDLLRAIARIKPSGAPYAVVVANDQPSAAASVYNGDFTFGWCGGPPAMARKGRVAVGTARSVLADRPSLILCGHVNYAPLCRWLGALFGIPYLVMTYGIDVWSLSSAGKRKALARARKVTALSRYTADRLSEQVEFSPGQLVVQPHPVRDHFRPGPKPRRLEERFGLQGKRVLLTVARLAQSERYKGYDQVMDALGAVARRVPDVRYLVVGDGDDLARAKRYAWQRGVADRVVFAGSVPNEELADYYNLCDLFVMPSRNEGQGIVFLEALACGKPVIAGASGGSREALLGGSLGLMVDSDRVNELSEAVLRMLGGRVDPALTDPGRLSKAVRDRFGFDRYCSDLESILTSCIEESAR